MKHIVATYSPTVPSEVDVERLLARFMAGETSREEEQQLGAFFRQPNVPEKWADYREMFAYFDAGMLQQSAAPVPLAAPKKQGRRTRFLSLGLSGVAAAAVGLAFLLSPSSEVDQRPMSAAPIAAACPAISAQKAPEVEPVKSEPLRSRPKTKVARHDADNDEQADRERQVDMQLKVIAMQNALALLDYEAKDQLEQVRAWSKEENANKMAVSALNDAIYWEDKPSTTTADASDANSITP